MPFIVISVRFTQWFDGALLSLFLRYSGRYFCHFIRLSVFYSTRSQNDSLGFFCLVLSTFLCIDDDAHIFENPLSFSFLYVQPML